jgi:adenine-specific DNA-methyltransferase
MSKIDKTELIAKLQQLEGLTDEEKSNLIGLLRQHKKYGLVWEDKPEDVEERLREELPVLKEVKERVLISDQPDAPNHILIEGDNLEALTALSYTHEGKIDVIYIDPPYNTGNKDFVYNDSYVDTEDSYRHSKWLSFMSKRLRIAKRLLSDKGVIFISIDDNEQANLKLLCDEVFGERNFTGQLIIKTATDNNPSQINTEHEYMLCYCSNKYIQDNWKRTSQAAKAIIEKYSELRDQNLTLSQIQKELRKWIKANKDNLPQVAHYNNVDEKGVYSSSGNSSNPHPGGYMYDIIHPVTRKACPKPQNGWRWPLSTFEEYDLQGEIEWGVDETTQPHVKKRIETSTEYLRTLIYEDNRGTTLALAEMFEGTKVFDNPKPIKVISKVIDFASIKSSTILDFFAGSGTTLHATIQLNAEDGGHRQCILVTNNENGICEQVTYERNKRVIQGYTTPKGQAVEGLHNNNLRYYRTEFIPRERTQRNMRALVNAATDLLCVKEDLYQELPVDSLQLSVKLTPKHVRMFGNGSKRMMVIYDERTIPYIVDGLLKETSKNTKEAKDKNDFGFLESFDVENKLKIYVFAPGPYAWDDDFAPVIDRVELCALPEAIYQAYKNVLPKKRNKYADEESTNEVDINEF